MKQLTALIIAIAVFVACNTKPVQEQVSTKEVIEKPIEEPHNSTIGKNNYSIVWKWSTDNVQLVEDNLVAISDEMNLLWKNGTMENAYYNANSEINKFEYFPNISYFLKANSLEQSKSILDKLLIVKKNIATYNIYPVGAQWLGRNTDKITENGITNSYVAVWSTIKEINTNENEKLIEEQVNQLLDLYNQGIIENVYWDFEDANAVKSKNNTTDFVFFINAKTEAEAQKICDDLPFTRDELVSYKILPVGVFWMGKSNNR